MKHEPTNAEKDALWKEYWSGKPSRVPVILATNNRVYVLDPRFNKEGTDYERIFSDAKEMLLSQLHWQDVARNHYHKFCDYATGLPDKWEIGVQWQNVYDAWFFGCPVEYRPGQVPDTRPIYAGDNKQAVFDIDIDNPLARDPFKRGIEFTEKLMEIAKSFEFKGRPVKILPYLPIGSDGPLTIGVNLRGSEFLMDLVIDPEYADKLMGFIVQANINRAKAVSKYWNVPLQGAWFADDSIETISTEMYIEKILPHHRKFYDALDPDHKFTRSIHLCGDAYRHFPTIAKELGVRSFDTGFPVDFKWVRKMLGPDIEIMGGVEVGLLMNGTPEQVYARAKEILTSGILEGKKFVLREANNLPPATPEKNLAAMYKAAFDFGTYPS